MRFLRLEGDLYPRGRDALTTAKMTPEVVLDGVK
jgi:hypothetical protein